MIIIMTPLVIKIHALIDFVIFLGISVSCTLEKKYCNVVET